MIWTALMLLKKRLFQQRSLRQFLRDRVEQQKDEEEEAKDVENTSHLQMETDQDRLVVLSSNPWLWSEYISDADRICNLKAGITSAIYNFDLPTDISGYRVHPKQLYKVLINGEKIQRNWLVYFAVKELVFCVYCKNSATVISSSLLTYCYRNGRHIVTNHQKSWNY